MKPERHSQAWYNAEILRLLSARRVAKPELAVKVDGPRNAVTPSRANGARVLVLLALCVGLHAEEVVELKRGSTVFEAEPTNVGTLTVTNDDASITNVDGLLFVVGEPTNIAWTQLDSVPAGDLPASYEDLLKMERKTNRMILEIRVALVGILVGLGFLFWAVFRPFQ